SFPSEMPPPPLRRFFPSPQEQISPTQNIKNLSFFDKFLLTFRNIGGIKEVAKLLGGGAVCEAD
ncbi:MAG: hypothetical protein IJ945_10020, partial [Oscillospiraceae bacterium]|nr:hypothetical protein [Oscillospiraceae bacterium]